MSKFGAIKIYWIIWSSVVAMTPGVESGLIEMYALKFFDPN